MARVATGADIGLRSATLVRGTVKGNSFALRDFALAKVRSSELGQGWDELEPGFKLGPTRVGLSGKEVNLRYTRVPRVPDWQLKRLMRFEVEEIGDQSGSGLASDFNLLPELPEIEGEDVVLLAMARESLLAAHLEGLRRVGGVLDAFTPNSIALYTSFLRYGVVGDDTVLVANVGHDNVDVVIARGPDLVFARNLTGGSRLFDDAIAQRFGVSPEKASEIKERMATLEPSAGQDALVEKASRAILGAAGQLLSLLQSAVLFCKSQIKLGGLKVDRVLLCGGGARLAGLPRYLAAGMGVPVELFDPFRVVDLDALSAEAAELLEAHRLESVIALGLATMASDASAYSVEILPAALRKKREFLASTVWLVAAGVLALAYLGWDAWSTHRDLGLVEARASSVAGDLRRAKQTDRRTKEILERNEALAALSRELWHTAGAGEQLARVLEALERELPRDFWVTRLASDLRFDPELGVQRGAERPILSIEGRAREGTGSLAALYERFLAGLRQRLPEARIKETLSPDGSRFTIDLCLFAPPAGAELAAAEAGDARREPERARSARGAR